MPVFETLSELYGYTKNVTMKEVATITSIVAKEKVNERIENDLYGDMFNGQNSLYDHTFGLRDAAMVEKSSYGNGVYENGTSINVYINPKNDYFSDSNGENVTEHIVNFLDGGHKGFFKGRAIDYKGKQFFVNAKKDLTKGSELKSRMKDYMRRLGYVISRLQN